MSRYGLIGQHLTHSFSPKLHEIIFKNSDINGEYDLFQVEKDRLKGIIEGLKMLEVKGYNVTIPYKVEVLKYLDELSYEAKMIGAVNTLGFKDNRIIGYNTDYYGFGALLRKEKIEIKDKIAIILGTGGASKSVFHYLKNNGIKSIIFASRNPNKSNDIYPYSQIIDYQDLKKIKSIDIIINTSPLGMYPNIDASPVDKEILGKCNTAIDLIYNPIETIFARYGREIGIKTANGLYMLVAQGIKSQEIWNTTEFDDEFYNTVYSEVKKHVG